MNDQPQLGASLAVARVGAGMTLPELAERIGLPARQLRRWEAGKDRIDPATAERIAESLGLLPVELEQIGALLGQAADRRSGRLRPGDLTGLGRRDGAPLTPVEARERAAELLAKATALLETVVAEKQG
jgi:transcriptional regulator with XRE-family HTH domain